MSAPVVQQQRLACTLRIPMRGYYEENELIFATAQFVYLR